MVLPMVLPRVLPWLSKNIIGKHDPAALLLLLLQLPQQW